MGKLVYHYHQPSMGWSRLFITYWLTQIRLDYCTWLDLKILLQSCIFPLFEVDSNIEVALRYKLCNHSLSILKTLLYYPMSLLFHIFPYYVQQDKSLNFSVTEYIEPDLQLNFPVLWQLGLHWNQWDPIATQNCSLLVQCHLEQAGIGIKWPLSSYAHLWGETIWVNSPPPGYVIVNLNWKWYVLCLHTWL